MILHTRAKANKAARRNIKQSIRDRLRKDRLKEIAGRAVQGATGIIRGMKKKFIWRFKHTEIAHTYQAPKKVALPKALRRYLYRQRKNQRAKQTA